MNVKQQYDKIFEDIRTNAKLVYPRIFGIVVMNMQKGTLTIGEISEILNVPTSTLRFWEEKGLFQVAKGLNSYRSYTTTDLIHIADILFYRNMGIPVKDVGDFTSVSLSEHGEALKSVQERLMEKIQKYEHMYQQVCRQQQRYYTLLQLMVKPFVFEDIPFSCVVSWDFREKARMQQYVEDPSCYVWYRDTNHDSGGQKGLIVPAPLENGESSVLWHKTPGTKYLTFPVRAIVSRDYEGLEALDDVARVQSRCRTGCFMARYLLSCKENGQTVEYLKGYLEVHDFNGDTLEKDFTNFKDRA